MIENKLEAANEDNLKQILTYKYNNKLLDRIIFNKHLCDREEIELIRDSILSNNLNFHPTKIKLANDQKLLMNKNINISSDFWLIIFN